MPKDPVITPDENQPAFKAEPEGEVTATFPSEIKVGEIEGEKKEEVKPEKKKEEPTEEQPFRTFKTQEELDEYLAEEVTKRTPAKPEEVKPEEKKPIKLYEGYYDEKAGKWVGEAPKDWNDFANKILEVMTPQVATEIQGKTVAERAELDEINKGFDKEYNDLARQGKVPALNTEEGQEINKQISLIGATYGQTTIIKAHELWSKIPKDQGGGLDYVAPAKQKLEAQKQKAGLVGSSKGTPSKTKTPMSYDKLHNKPLDDLVDEQLGE